MIVRRRFVTRRKAKKFEVGFYVFTMWEGIFLFGFIPLYITDRHIRAQIYGTVELEDMV